MKKHAYYKKGTRDNIIINNSGMGYINPKQGGSPSKFLEAFDENREQLNTRSVNNGTVVHDFIENPNDFAIDSATKPTESICSWVEEILRIIKDNEVSKCEILSEINSESFTEFTNGLSFAYPDDIELTNDLIRDIVFQARTNLGLFNNIKKPETLITKFNDSGALTYILFILQNSNKHILSEGDHHIVTSCIDSLKNNKFIQNKLFRPENDDFKVFKEIAIFFMIPVTLRDGTKLELKGKALIDVLHVDLEYNKAIINDLKTTGKGTINDMSNDKDQNKIGSIQYYRYYRQLAWYKFAIECVANPNIKTMILDSEGRKIESLKFKEGKELKVYTNIIAVETSKDFRSGILPINEEWIKKGDKEAQSLIYRIAWHIHHKMWDISMEEHLNNGVIPVENPSL